MATHNFGRLIMDARTRDGDEIVWDSLLTYKELEDLGEYISKLVLSKEDGIAIEKTGIHLHTHNVDSGERCRFCVHRSDEYLQT